MLPGSRACCRSQVQCADGDRAAMLLLHTCCSGVRQGPEVCVLPLIVIVPPRCIFVRPTSTLVHRRRLPSSHHVPRKARRLRSQRLLVNQYKPPVHLSGIDRRARDTPSRTNIRMLCCNVLHIISRVPPLAVRDPSRGHALATPLLSDSPRQPPPARHRPWPRSACASSHRSSSRPACRGSS